MRRALPFVLATIVIGAGTLSGCGVDKKKLRDKKNAGSTAGGVTTPTPATNLPDARAEHTAITLPSGDVFVAGGVDATGTPMISTVLITQSGVIAGPDMSSPRVGHTVTFDSSSGVVIIAGGQSDAAGATVLDTIDAYDPTTNAMAAGPPMAVARSHHAAVVYPAQAGLQILYVGGVGAAVTGPPAYLNSAEVLDVVTGVSTPVAATLTEAQKDARAVMLDTGDLLITSGEGANGAAAGDLYDPTTGLFTPLAGGASVFGAATASDRGRLVYMAGGQNQTAAVDTVDVFDSATSLSTPGPRLSEARADAASSTLSSGLAVIGGATPAGVSGLVEVVSGTPLAVVAAPALTTPRWGHTASTLTADRVMVVGGYDASGIVTDSIETLDLAAYVTATTPPTPPVTPPPAPLPPGTITTFPHFDDFDAGMGLWVDSTADDFDWTANNGGTPSLDTGPTADHTSGNGQYIYTESSYPNDTNKTAIIEGPNFGNFTTLEMRFWFHMRAPTTGTYLMGSASLDVSTDNGATWTLDEWTMTGDQGANWVEAIVDLSAYAGQAVKVRFRVVTASFNSDVAIDDISVSDVPGPVAPPPPPPPPPPAVTAFPYAENFDAGFGGWNQSTTDDFDWTQNTGGTGSTNTGPDFDHTSGNGSYLYTESSYPNDNNKIAIIDGPTFGNFSTLEMRFWYHMLGDVGTGQLMGSMSLDVSTDGGATWTLDEWTMSGSQGTAWLEAVVDLSAYAGQNVTLRFRGVTASFRSDMAVDDIAVTGTP